MDHIQSIRNAQMAQYFHIERQLLQFRIGMTVNAFILQSNTSQGMISIPG